MTAALEHAVEADEIVAGLSKYMTQKDIAFGARVSDRTVRDWAKNSHVVVRDGNYQKLTEVRQVVLVLRDSLTPRGVRQWMSAKNRLLEDRRPIDVLHAGDAPAVMRAAAAFVDGVYV